MVSADRAAPAPAAPDLDALRALHNPEGAPPPAPTVPSDLDALFVAAPIPKQVELAVALLDRLEHAARR